MNTLSLCMIVKDGEQYIEQCIESVLPAVSEIIVVDTGSSDGTSEKIKRFNPSVYRVDWKNDFSEARNESLRHAKGDYLIVLDADEVVYAEDLPKLANVLKNTKADCISVRFHNLNDENDESIFNIHDGLRIFKNGSHHFEGAIHEQPVFNFKDRKPIMENSGVRIKHYGYLKSNAGEKKFKRNMDILEKVLKENPNEPFHLFNMGNQYMSAGDFKTALEYYEKANKLKDTSLAYCPHLLFRRASCLRISGRAEECLEAVDEALKIYPACTDLEFMRALTLAGMKRFTLALDSFNRCIQMGQAPPNLCFFPDVGDVRPLIEKAEIYYATEDYKKALDCYLKALKADKKRYYLIYKIASVLNKMLTDKDAVYKNICGLFADSAYKPNTVITADALFNEKLFKQARSAFEKFAEDKDSDILFLKGRLMFYSKDYESAFSLFESSVCPNTEKGILPEVKKRAYEYMCACAFLCEQCLNRFKDTQKSMDDSLEKSVYFAFLHCGSQDFESLNEKALEFAAPVLSKLLSVREYDAFEKALNILNAVESDKVLLCLAQVYFENGFYDMALKTVKNSVKEFDALDSKAVAILSGCL